MKELIYPLATEKAINMLQRDNIITYVVNTNATKASIKKEFEAVFKVKVANVSTVRSITNIKKAYIKLAPEYKASDIALKLKLI